MERQRKAPPNSRLAVCLFTHNGRRAVLAQALQSVFDQLADPALADVQVCVTDNASHDGTEELLAELALEHGERLRYLRHERNLGLSRNLLSCVELAQSEYCWILTSDDAIEAGGISRVLELIAIAEHRPPGVVVNKANFDFELTQLADQGGPHFYPPEQRRTIQYSDADRFINDCGLLTSLVSTLIVRRENWLQALAELGRDEFAETTIFPHLPIIARMARRDPHWIWCPAKLVRVRMDNAFLASDEGWSVDRIHTRLLRDMGRMWARHLGRRSPVRRSLLRRAYSTFATPKVLRSTAPGGRSVRARLALIGAYLPTFWWISAFWRETLPGLLLAGSSTRRVGAGHGVANGPLSPEQRVAAVSAQGAPTEAPARHEISLRLEIENVARVAFRSRPPYRVVIGYRWHAPGGEVVLQGPPLPLPHELPPDRAFSHEIEVLTPSDAGPYRLHVALAQEDVGWFDDRDPALACWVPIEIHSYGWTDLPTPA